MDTAFTYALYCVAIILLVLSYVRDKQKTILSLKKSWKMFMRVLPQFTCILFVVGILLTIVTPDTIRQVIGSESGFVGMIITSMLGAVVLVPALIAFPIAADLLRSGAGIMQIAVFISTLTMVGFATIPVEMKYLGRKAAVLRNALAFLFAFATSIVIGVILS